MQRWSRQLLWCCRMARMKRMPTQFAVSLRYFCRNAGVSTSDANVQLCSCAQRIIQPCTSLERCHSMQTVHASTFRLRSVHNVFQATGWRPVDQAGFRVALAAYLSDPPDPSFDSIQPQLLKFKLTDALRKAVRSHKLAKFFKRDVVLKGGAKVHKSAPGAAQSKESAGPSADKMASVLHSLRKSRCHRTQPRNTPSEGRMQV